MKPVTNDAENGSPNSTPASKGNGCAAGTESESERIRLALNRGVCPECGAPLVFGSRDPCEGDFYWCSAHPDERPEHGPFLFPLHARVRSRPSLIDAELLQCINRARQVETEIQSSISADQKAFDPRKAVSDIVGS